MKILIGYDGSECSAAAIDDLSRAGLAKEGEAIVLTAAHLWPYLTHNTFEVQDPLPLDAAAWLDPAAHNARLMAQRALAEARDVSTKGAARLREVFPNWRIESQAVTDTPHAALIAKCDSWHPDLLVVGSHGRAALGRLIVGSVSNQVLMHAHCSVRIARAAARNEGPPRIMIGFDGSSESMAAVNAVAGRNWPQGTQVRVVSIIYVAIASMVPFPEATSLISSFSMERDEATKGLTKAVEQLRESKLYAEPAVYEGDPKRQLLEVAKRFNPDTIFVGAKGRSRLDRFLLGSVSSAVATRAHCTVEVVRPIGP